MKITQTNNRYVIELGDNKIHVLNRKALIWNLKNTFGIQGEQGKQVMRDLDLNGQIEINLNKAA